MAEVLTGGWQERMRTIASWARADGPPVMAVLPCGGTRAGYVRSACELEDRPLWANLVRFADTGEVFRRSRPSWVAIDPAAGVLHPDDYRQAQPVTEWTKERIAALQRELVPLAEGKRLLLLLPPPHRAALPAFHGLAGFDAFAGMSDSESRLLAAALSSRVLGPDPNMLPALPVGLIVISPRPVAGSSLVATPLGQIVGYSKGLPLVGAWPRTAWPAPARPMKPQALLPTAIWYPPISDQHLDDIFRQRAEVYQQQAPEANPAVAWERAVFQTIDSLTTATKRMHETGVQPLFGPEAALGPRLDERRLPWKGIVPRDWTTTVLQTMDGIAGAAQPVIAAVWQAAWGEPLPSSGSRVPG